MSGNPGALVYGAVTIGAVLAVESALQETYGRTLAAAIVALTLYWLAHSYDEFTRQRARAKIPLRSHALLRIARQEASLVLGAALPLLALVVAWVTGAALSSGVAAATWTAAGTIVVIEVALGLRSALEPRELVAQTVLGIVLGLLVIAVRALLH